MSVAQVVDHLYEIRKKDDHVQVFFRTNRVGPFFAIFLIAGLCFAAIWAGFRLGWRDEIMSVIIGGSISFVAIACFSSADQITRYVITIEPDVVSLQREFQGIPVGVRKIYHRALISDLGMYGIEHRRPGALAICNLCLWADHKSIQLESFFPISEGVSLTNDLRSMGIEFPRTHEAYHPSRAAFASSEDYFSF